MIYTDLKGVQHYLDEAITNNPIEAADLEIKYAHIAKMESIKKQKDVFYCLKTKGSGAQIYTQANYFIIPIDREEIDHIVRLYNNYCYIGIIYLRQIFH